MPRQTTATNDIQFPDGAQFAVDVGDGFEDMGILAGGTTATVSWDIQKLDGGNYKNVKYRGRNYTCQLSPSAIWSFSNRVFNKMLGGVTEVSGNDLTFKGSHYLELTDLKLRLAHFDDEDKHTLIEDDITALDTDTVNDYVTVPKSTFTTDLTWTTDIDSLLKIAGMHEVHSTDKNTEDAQGNYYTDATNLYFIVATGTYADLAAAKTGLAGTVVTAFSNSDWQFTLYNANVDPGVAWNFKGVNEDGVDEFNVTFTGRPDPDDGYKMIKLFGRT